MEHTGPGTLDFAPRAGLSSPEYCQESFLTPATAPPEFAAGTPSLLRAINERSVLELIRRDRRHVARRGRPRAAASPSRPSRRRWLGLDGRRPRARRSAAPRGPQGARRGRSTSLNPESGWVVGIDVGSHWVRAALADITGTVRRPPRRAHASRSSGALVAQIGEIAHGVASERGIALAPGHARHRRQLRACSIPSRGPPGPQPQPARLGQARAWSRRSRAELGAEISFENDVNLAALGERAHGVGHGIRNFVFLWVGTGVGLGIVIDGELYRGAAGAAGEIAYLPVGPGDPHDPGLPPPRPARGVGARRAAARRLAREHGLRPAARRRASSPPPRGRCRRRPRSSSERRPHRAGDRRRRAGARSRAGDPGRRHRRQRRRPAARADRRASCTGSRRSGPGWPSRQLGDEVVLHGAVATRLQAAQETLFTSQTPAHGSPSWDERSEAITDGDDTAMCTPLMLAALLVVAAGCGGGQLAARQQLERPRSSTIAHAGHDHRLASVDRRRRRSRSRTRSTASRSSTRGSRSTSSCSPTRQRHVRPAT